MSDNAPITGELREYATVSWDPWPAARDWLYQMCDAIDAIHVNLERENESLRRELDRDGWVELPKDTDGEYIRVGDMMERGKARGHVIALMLSEYPKKWGGALHWGVQLEGEQAPTALDCFFRHYHEPTVDDLLFSYGQACIRTSNEAETDAAKQTMLAKLREEYAVKLRLADDGKEQQ